MYSRTAFFAVSVYFFGFHNFQCLIAAENNLFAFSTEAIVPDSIDTIPLSEVTVAYETDSKVRFGNILTRGVIRNPPSIVKWTPAQNKTYLLTLVDLDPPHPSIPFLGEINHWMVGNIPGNDWLKGQILSHYAKPSPPPFGGLHRFVFLVYEQPQLCIDYKSKDIKFFRFSIREFAKQYNLGEPIAGNFYQSRF